MSRIYTATYNGQRYDLTSEAWHELLKDQPVFEHITLNCMRLRLRKRHKTGKTIGVCLGITEHRPKHSGKKDKKHAVNPRVVMVGGFLNRMARVAV